MKGLHRPVKETDIYTHDGNALMSAMEGMMSVWWRGVRDGAAGCGQKGEGWCPEEVTHKVGFQGRGRRTNNSVRLEGRV